MTRETFSFVGRPSRGAISTRRLHAFMEHCLGRSRTASKAHVDRSETRVLQRLRQDPMWTSDAPLFETTPGPQIVPSAFRRKSRTPWVAAAAVVALVVGGWAVRDVVGRRSQSAVVEAGDSSIYMISDGQTRPLQPNEQVAFGEIVRSNGGAGGMLRLTDGSRVEVRSQSELTFERADDGVRIRLGKGGIIVNAAKQRDGHLYVQTKDVTVSVVGTVFLVNAEEQGSRVAVIEGEVRVQQGATEHTLRPGEQVTTNPGMPSLPVKEEVAWSRQADAHVALLQQASVPQLPFRPAPQDERVHFEVTSIRPSDTSSDSGGRGGGDGSGTGINQWGCGISSPTIDPRRFSVTKTTVYSLIVWAYGSKGLNAPGCTADSQLSLISGGPGWIKSELFDVVAAIPEGVTIESRERRGAGDARVLRTMLQAMLEEMFKVVVRRETREVPAYSLSVTGDALKGSGASEPARWLTQGEPGPEDKLLGGALRDPGVIGDTGVRNGEVMHVVRGRNASMADLATHLGPPMGRPILDRTGLAGRFNFDFWVAPIENGSFTNRLLRSMPHATTPIIFAALAEAGLRLEPARTPLEVLVIAQVERPPGN